MSNHSEKQRLPDRFDLLNAGERACLDFVLQGKVSKEIARDLGLSPHTVDDRLRSACRKLGARNRFQAAQIYLALKQDSEGEAPAQTSRLRYEDSDIPKADVTSDEGSSAGKGYGSDDLDPHQGATSDSKPGSEIDALRPEAKSPYATFFGGENRLSIGRRLIYIAAIATGIAVAFGGITNGLIELSKIFSSP